MKKQSYCRPRIISSHTKCVPTCFLLQVREDSTIRDDTGPVLPVMQKVSGGMMIPKQTKIVENKALYLAG